MSRSKDDSGIDRRVRRSEFSQVVPPKAKAVPFRWSSGSCSSEERLRLGPKGPDRGGDGDGFGGGGIGGGSAIEV